MLPSVKIALAHYELTGQIRGPKTSAFARALQGDRRAVVVDVWIARALRIPEEDLSSRRVYAHAARRIRGAAAHSGLPVRDAQAAIWTAVRARFGFRDRGDLLMVAV
jgi:hypothetical protein